MQPRSTDEQAASSRRTAPERPVGPGPLAVIRVRSGTPLADQFVSSVTNGLALLAAALLRAEPGVLGEIAVVSAIVMLQIDVVRAWVVLPAQLAESTTDRRRLAVEGAIAGVPIALLTLLAGIMVDSNALAVAAFCLPAIAAFETLRSIWLGDRAASTALRWDTAWLASTSALLLAVWLAATMNAALLTLAWLLPGAVLALVAGARQSRTVIAPRRKMAGWRIRSAYAADTMIGQFSNLLPIALAAFMGSSAAALWQGARIAFRPIGVGGNLLPVLVPPMLAGRESGAPSSASTLVRKVSLWTLLATIVCLPVAIVLQVYRDVGVAIAMSWSLLVAMEYIAVNALTVTQTVWKAGGAPATAVRLRSLAALVGSGGLALAILLDIAIVAQAGVVVGLATALVWSGVSNRKRLRLSDRVRIPKLEPST